MNLQYRIDLLDRLREYILSDDSSWQQAREHAYQENGWFTPEFIDYAATAIAKQYLDKTNLEDWISAYNLDNSSPNNIGIVMAGNIPMAGFHDWLSVFISGHKATIKLSSKDQVLIKHLIEKLAEFEPAIAELFQFAPMLKGCDAYIATGSNNSSRYFDYYFGKYPNIIRRNRTSAAILRGDETPGELEKLADDVFIYFGLGCRNVTRISVPTGYDFIPLLDAFNKYGYLADHHKYKSNYDYNLALHLLNKVEYMTNGSVLLVKDERLFSPISQLNYIFYDDLPEHIAALKTNEDLQAIVADGWVPFGHAQSPAVSDYADGVDTLAFLAGLARVSDGKP